MASTSPIALGGPLALQPFLRLLEQHTEKAIFLRGSFNIWIWCSPQVSYNPLPQRVWLMYISILKNWFGGSFSLVMASISPHYKQAQYMTVLIYKTDISQDF